MGFYLDAKVAEKDELSLRHKGTEEEDKDHLDVKIEEDKEFNAKIGI